MDSEVTDLKTQIRHIGHEIRNQLSICDIYSEILKKHIAKENINNPSVDNAINCIQNAVKIIGNNLLDLKLMGEIVIHTCNSEKLIKACIDMSTAYAKEKNIEFVTNLEPETKILVDENKFQGCIINIIKNAIEAIETNGKITISSMSENKCLIITISNNGTKIPEDKIDDIFKDGYTTKDTGTGTGLHMCKQNLLAMNGDIILAKTGNITEFEIKVPILA